jgi:hypothetical protein
MPDDDVTLDEIYAEIDKRVKAAIDAQNIETEKRIAGVESKIPKQREAMRILRKRA